MRICDKKLPLYLLLFSFCAEPSCLKKIQQNTDKDGKGHVDSLTKLRLRRKLKKKTRLSYPRNVKGRADALKNYNINKRFMKIRQMNLKYVTYLKLIKNMQLK